jgi:hypothetical protein
MVQFFGRGGLEMGLIQKAIATLSHETLIGILEMAQNGT